MCRSTSKFVTPSSIFYREGQPEKDQVVASYMGSMARVPCKQVIHLHNLSIELTCLDLDISKYLVVGFLRVALGMNVSISIWTKMGHLM